jgi:hypothetical protein
MPTFIEDKETRSLNFATGRTTATRRFHVFNDGSPLTTPAAVFALFGTSDGSTTLPQEGDTFPGESDVFCTSFAIELVPESRNVWLVTFTYENTEPGTVQPLEEGYVEFSIDYAFEFRDFYRVNPELLLPTNGTPTLANIEGTRIDAAGEPLSAKVNISTITVTETVALASLEARSQVIRVLRGRRNSSVFYGAPIGQVAYQGASARRVALDKVQIQHTFQQDGLYFMAQQPARNPEKEVDLEQVNGIWRAKSVFWVQPFPDFGDLNELSENF